jgi:hypothetical protein
MEGIHRYPKLPMVGWLGDIYDGWYVYYISNYISISVLFMSFMARKVLSSEYPPMGILGLSCHLHVSVCEVFCPFELYRWKVSSREQ